MVFNGKFGGFDWSIADTRGISKPSNIKKAYYLKIIELRQFCDSLYVNEENLRVVTGDKAYRCVSYHTHRKKMILKKESQPQIKLCKYLSGRIMIML